MRIRRRMHPTTAETISATVACECGEPPLCVGVAPVKGELVEVGCSELSFEVSLVRGFPGFAEPVDEKLSWPALANVPDALSKLDVLTEPLKGDDESGSGAVDVGLSELIGLVEAIPADESTSVDEDVNTVFFDTVSEVERVGRVVGVAVDPADSQEYISQQYV